MKSNGWIAIILFMVFIVLLLFACNSTAPEQTSVPTSNTHSPSASQTMVPSRTMTPRPTLTPSITMTREPTDVKPIAQMLLTDYFATPSPTFDAGSVVTKTTGNAINCPQGGNNEIFETDKIWLNRHIERNSKMEYMLQYLNDGGDIRFILREMRYQLGNKKSFPVRAYYGDLTGDNFPELLFFYISSLPGYFEFIGCDGEEYKNYYSIDLGGTVYIDIISINDLNMDGIDEVVLMMDPGVGTSYWHGYFIIGWTGESFENLISQPGYYSLNPANGIWRDFISMSGLGAEYPSYVNPWDIVDIDGNGTMELLVRGGMETSWDGIAHGPYQPITQTYMWNGEGYVLQEMVIGPPEYRYQAIQNGDLYTLLKDYDQAREVYQQAIENSNLKWWSDDTPAYIRAQLDARLGLQVTPTLGVPDENEYPNLAAYAKFRLLLLDVLQDDIESAKQEFDDMQENYIEGTEGYIFVQYADVFLEEYHNSLDVKLACTSAHEFGMRHEAELLKYLDVDHGFQSMSYTLDSLCPFQ